MMKQRGFTLVEITITLAVIGIMTSYLAFSYYQYEEQRRLEEVVLQMEQIKKAIFNYAAANNTDSRIVQVVENPSPPATPVYRWVLPGARPYLPCPDITGDGIEDRIAPSAVGVTLTIALSVDLDIMPSALEATGGCYSNRGVVPWRTLNTPPNDPWGNRYSYRVADAFSNAITGFDQYSKADSIYRARPLNASADGVPMAQSFGWQTASSTLTLAGWSELQRYAGPAVVCSVAPCPDSIVSLTTAVPISLSVLVIGDISDSAVTISRANIAAFDGVVQAELPVNAVLSGLPFVLVSHGRNGYGGVRHDQSGYVCNRFPVGEFRDDERQNAMWLAATRVSLIGTAAYNCPRSNIANEPAANFPEQGFVVGINYELPYQGFDITTTVGIDNFNADYDDILIWASAGELIESLVLQRALPVNLLPPIGLEQGE